MQASLGMDHDGSGGTLRRRRNDANTKDSDGHPLNSSAAENSKSNGLTSLITAAAGPSEQSAFKGTELTSGNLPGSDLSKLTSPNRRKGKNFVALKSFDAPVSSNTFHKALPLYDEQYIRPWQRGNELIRSYYRCHYTSLQCVMSIFTLHNETFNVWLHVFGFIFLLVLSSHIFAHLGLQEKADYVVFSIFEVCSLVMFGASSVYHTFSGHYSETVHNFVLGMDYFGITLMIIGSFVPPVFYLFGCLPFYRYLYLGLIVGLGILAMTGPSIVSMLISGRDIEGDIFEGSDYGDETPGLPAIDSTYFEDSKTSCAAESMADGDVCGASASASTVPTPLSPNEEKGSKASSDEPSPVDGNKDSVREERRHLCCHEECAEEPPLVRWTRFTLYILMVSTGLLPLFHILLGLPRNDQTLPISLGLGLMLLFYTTGTCVYVFRIPEVMFPGYFDLFFSSHQLWHFFILVAAVVHYFTCMGIFQLFRVSAGSC